jgi:sirohydrochlorin cobaltochelatase
MMTRGGEHAEVDIPAAIDRSRERHPGISIQYAWPFDTTEIADFLASQIQKRA